MSKEEKTINIVDISKQSSEAILDARRINEQLISIEELLKKKQEIDSLVNSINTKIKKDKKVDIAAEGLRKLETSLIFLKQEKSLLKREKDGLSSRLNKLVGNKDVLSTNLKYWKDVKRIVRTKKLGRTIGKSVDEVLAVLNNTILITTRLTNVTMGMMRDVTALELEINTRIAFFNMARQQKQGELLSLRQSSFLTLDYSDKKSWNLSIPFSQFYKVDLKNLKNYIVIKYDILIFHIFLIIILIMVFVRLSKTPISLENEQGLFYKKRLKELLSRPISTALIIGLFASVILYTNRPLVFIDVLLLLVIVPMVFLLTSIFDVRFRIYIYALVVVLVSKIVYSYLPVANIFSRFLLLFIALIELIAVLHFILRFKWLMIRKKGLGRMVLFFCYEVVVVIIVGLVGNLLGKVMLSRYLLFSISGNALVSFLIIVTAILANGIAVVFISSKLADKSNFLHKNKIFLLRKVPRFFNFIAVIGLGLYILNILGWKNSVVNSITEWLTYKYEIGSLTFSWGRLFVFVFIIWFSIFIAKIVRAILEDDILNKVKMEEGLPHTIAMMVRYTLVTFGILLAISALGMPLNDLAIIFSAFGVGIGFGLQSIFNNIVSGLILLFERPIKIGDTVEVGDLIGTVRSIGIRASNIRTFDGAEIIVPNGNLISNEVVNR